MKQLLLVGVVAAAVSLLASPAGAERASAPAATTAKAVTLKAKKTRFGVVLFSGGGRVLYAFTRDRRGGPSRCYGDCATAWPVYYTSGTAVAGTGVKRSLLGKSRRRDGRFQVTYAGWPLYFYAHEGPGEVRCQNVSTHGGTWLVVRPSGTLVR
jgi:predicted lipoprotein with Yx(FWY)xxD motif